MKALWLGLTAALMASTAQAALTISTDATSNVTCSGGVCSATAADAVLNVGDVTTMLASSALTIQSGNQAQDILVEAPFSWTSANALTLGSYRAITVDKRVSDGGPAALTLTTNDGGSGGTLSFLHGGHIRFSNLKDALIINGTNYKLYATLKKLVYDVVAHPKGAFALAASYNAKQDGAYSSSPIAIPFTGSFSGLGNTISNLEIENMTDSSVGLFAEVASSGSVSGLNLKNVVVRGGQTAGGLFGLNNGVVANSSTSGVVNAFEAGGLVGYNYGMIFRSSSSANIHSSGIGGGLASAHYAGSIAESFATGKLSYNHQPSGRLDNGGLVGDVFAPIRDSYAQGNLNSSITYEGGLVGFINEAVGGAISTSYSTGFLKAGSHKNPISGGFIGYLYVETATIFDCYWDTTTSGTLVGVGGGGDESGITGLTTSQLQSGLPAGFDPNVWAEDSEINNGYPYLIANPPAK